MELANIVRLCWYSEWARRDNEQEYLDFPWGHFTSFVDKQVAEGRYGSAARLSVPVCACSKNTKSGSMHSAQP
jgi:hypothetical protein